MNASVIRVLRQITRRFIHTIVRLKSNTINHDMNITKLRNAYRAAHPKRLLAPRLCLATTYPQNPGEDLITTQVITIPQHIQSTKYTHGRKMAPPPGTPLLFGTIAHDVTNPSGITMHPQRHFTVARLQEYHLLH